MFLVPEQSQGHGLWAKLLTASGGLFVPLEEAGNLAQGPCPWVLGLKRLRPGRGAG